MMKQFLLSLLVDSDDGEGARGEVVRDEDVREVEEESGGVVVGGGVSTVKCPCTRT
jgi:hypothetical protein